MNVRALNIHSVKYNFLAYSRQEAVVHISGEIRTGRDYWRKLIRWAAQQFPDISVVHVEHANSDGTFKTKDYHFELDFQTQEWSEIRPKYTRFAGEWLDQSPYQIESIGRIDGDSRHG